MNKPFPTAVVLLCLLALPAAAETPGYGPWRLGMSRDEITAATAEGPYSAVSATGGLETRNASFEGQPITASFVFGDRGLKQIQLWVYEGRDRDQALAAFHRAYLYLSRNLGTLTADGKPVPAGLSSEELSAGIPPQFKTGTSQSQLEKLPQQGSFDARIHKLHLYPQKPAAGAEIYGSLIHSPQLGMYWVFVYVKSPAGS